MLENDRSLVKIQSKWETSGMVWLNRQSGVSVANPKSIIICPINTRLPVFVTFTTILTCMFLVLTLKRAYMLNQKALGLPVNKIIRPKHRVRVLG